MGVGYNPRCVQDGLLVCLDSANKRCFRGEPTTNLFYDNGIKNWSIVGLGGSVINTTTIEENNRYRFESVSGIGQFRMYALLAKLTNGLTYNLSFKYKMISGSSFVYSDWCDVSVSSNRIIESRDDYYFQSGYGSRATYDSTYRFADFNLPVGSVVEVWDLQLEQRNYYTPFVNGVRGATVETGGGLFDLSGNSRHGELANNPVYNSPKGGSILFDGVNDYIITNYDLSWNNTNSAAIEFFCKPNNINQRAGIVGKPSPNWEWSIMHGENGITNSSLTFVYWTTGGGHTNGPVINISNFFSTEWVHVVVSWNHITSETSIYKNGVLQRTDFWTAPSTNQNRNNNIYLGGGIYTWNTGYWNGELSLFRVYNRSLSAKEVWQNFNATRSRFGI